MDGVQSSSSRLPWRDKILRRTVGRLNHPNMERQRGSGSNDAILPVCRLGSCGNVKVMVPPMKVICNIHDKQSQTTDNFPLAHSHWEPQEPRPVSKCSMIREERETDGCDDAWSVTCVARKMPVIAQPDVETKQGANRRHPRPRPRDKVMKPRPVYGEGGKKRREPAMMGWWAG